MSKDFLSIETLAACLTSIDKYHGCFHCISCNKYSMAKDEIICELCKCHVNVYVQCVTKSTILGSIIVLYEWKEDIMKYEKKFLSSFLEGYFRR